VDGRNEVMRSAFRGELRILNSSIWLKVLENLLLSIGHRDTVLADKFMAQATIHSMVICSYECLRR
jgi:hypothetical protein